jgi:hypothetical protein
VVRSEAKGGMPLLERCHVALEAFVWSKRGPLENYTLFKVYSTYLEAYFTFEVFGIRPLFEAFSTYLEESPLHEEMPCGIVDMVQTLKQRINAYFKKISWNRKMTSGKWTYSKGKRVPSQIRPIS